MSRASVLLGLMAMMMLAAMDTTIVSTAVPQIVAELGGLTHVSWVFSVYLVAQTVTIPVYGKLSDLVGRKPVLLGGTLLFLVGSVACAAAWDMGSLIVFRGLQGLGAGAIMATVMTLAGDLYAVEERGAVQGWLSSVWGMAAIAGPVLGGAFAQYASWRWACWCSRCWKAGRAGHGARGRSSRPLRCRRWPSSRWCGWNAVPPSR